MGERNTGTRYLQQLLQKNLPISHLRLAIDGTKLNAMSETQKDELYNHKPEFWGWKHACGPSRATVGLRSEETARLLFVVTSKNPYSWLLSMWRHPYHYIGDKPLTFEKFLFRPWGVVGRERFEACGGEQVKHAHHQRHFKGPVDMWNRKMKSFALLAAPHVAKVRYEDLVADPAAVVAHITATFALGKNGRESSGGSGGFQNVESSTKTKGKDYGSYRDFYLKELWKDKWDCPRCLRYVNAELDDEVLELWSYPRWSGLSEREVALKLNGQPSWMETPRPGAAPPSEKAKSARAAKPPTFVSAATLARQNEQAELLKKRREGAAAHGGHAPPSSSWKQRRPNINRPPPSHGRTPLQGDRKGGGASGGGMRGSSGLHAPQKHPPQPGWEVAQTNPSYGDVSAHKAIGGPMGVTAPN